MVKGFRFTNLSDTNFTKPEYVADYLNDTTNGLYGSIFLVGIFILLILMQRKIGEFSIMVAGIVTSFIAILFFIFGFVPDTTVAQFILLTAFGFFISVMGGRSK